MAASRRPPCRHSPTGNACGCGCRRPRSTTSGWLSACAAACAGSTTIGDARLRGLVTAFTSPQQFEVQGIAVDASNAVFGAQRCRGGARCAGRVRGNAAGGKIVATRVKVRNENDDDLRRGRTARHGERARHHRQDLPAARHPGRLQQGPEWKNGAPADLANGKQLEVKGLWVGPTARTLIAVVIEFES